MKKTDKKSLQFEDFSNLLKLERFDELKSEIRNTLNADPNNLDALYHQAVSFGLESKYNMAFEYIEKCISINKKYCLAACLKADYLMQMHRYSESEKILNDLFKSNELNQTVYVYVSKLYRITKLKSTYITMTKNAAKSFPQNLNFLLELANLYQMQARTVEAQNTIKKALKIDPDFLRGYDKLFDIYKVSFKYKKALETCEKALQINPESVTALTNKATILRLMQKYDESLECLETVLEIFPTYSEALLELAALHGSRFDFKLQKKALDSAFELNPKNLRVLKSLSEYLYSQKKFEKCESILQSILKMNEGNLDAIVRLIIVNLNKQNFETAEKLIERISLHSLNQSLFHYMMGLLEEKKENIGAALRHHSKSLQINPHFLNNLLRQVKLHAILGRFEKSEVLLKKYYQKNCYEPLVTILKGDLLIMQNKYSRGRLYLKSVLSNQSYKIHAFLNLGIVEKNLQKYSKAIGYFDKCLEINPMYTTAQLHKGESLFFQNKISAAIEIYQGLLSQNCFLPIVIRNLTDCYLKNKETALAVGFLTQALDKYQDLPKTRNLIYILLFRLGQRKLGIKYFEQALRRNPNDIDAMILKAKYLFQIKQKEEFLQLSHLILEKDERRIIIWNLLCQMYLNFENYKFLLETSEKALKIFPSHCAFLFYRGRAFELNKMTEESVKVYKEILQRDHLDFDSFFQLAEIYKKKKKWVRLGRLFHGFLKFHDKKYTQIHEKNALENIQIKEQCNENRPNHRSDPVEDYVADYRFLGEENIVSELKNVLFLVKRFKNENNRLLGKCVEEERFTMKLVIDFQNDFASSLANSFAESLDSRHKALLLKFLKSAKSKLTSVREYYSKLQINYIFSNEVRLFRNCFIKNVVALDGLLAQIALLKRPFIERNRIKLQCCKVFTLLKPNYLSLKKINRELLAYFLHQKVDVHGFESFGSKAIAKEGFLLAQKYLLVFGKFFLADMLQIMDHLLMNSWTSMTLRFEDSQYKTLDKNEKYFLDQLVPSGSIFNLNYNCKSERFAFYLFNLVRSFVERLQLTRVLRKTEVIVEFINNLITHAEGTELKVLMVSIPLAIKKNVKCPQLAITGLKLLFFEYHDSVCVRFPGWDDSDLYIETKGKQSEQSCLFFKLQDWPNIKIEMIGRFGLFSHEKYFCYLEIEYAKFKLKVQNQNNVSCYIWKIVNDVSLIVGFVNLQVEFQ